MRSKIKQIHNHMMKYQKKKNSIKRCLDNSQILYDYCKYKGIKNVKAQAYICSGEKEDGTPFSLAHLAIMIDSERIDPSYEINSLPNIKYYKSYREFMDSKYSEGFNEDILKLYLKFVKYSDSMNSDKFVVSNQKYYTNQFDYLRGLCLN